LHEHPKDFLMALQIRHLLFSQRQKLMNI